METIPVKLGGRPKKYTQVAYFGLKMQPEDKMYLQLLAKSEKKPASTIVVELVHKACEEKNIVLENYKTKKRMPAREFLALPLEEQEKILHEQAKVMAKFYEVIEDNQPLLDY